MAKIIGVKFKNTSKIYYFAPKEGEVYRKNDGVIVETSKGTEYGSVSFPVKEVDDSAIVQPLKRVIRKTNDKDRELMRRNEAKIPDNIRIAEKCVEKNKLNMKIVSCEYSYDGKKAIFYFTSEGRVDFRDLVKELAGQVKARIELRQIGIRDETKMLGGIAPCGRECCCAGSIPEYKRVSIKMAKTQGLSLNPTKISGLCGRLMCCLEYENDFYSEAYKLMPKLGSIVLTPDGEGTVINNNMLKKICKVKITDGKDVVVYKDYDLKQLKVKKQPNNRREDEDSEDIKKLLD